MDAATEVDGQLKQPFRWLVYFLWVLREMSIARSKSKPLQFQFKSFHVQPPQSELQL